MNKTTKFYKFDKYEYDELCMSYIKKYKNLEEWKPVIINGITTKYIISNYGRIRNINKNIIPAINVYNRHYHVGITIDTGKYITIGIYRLVAMMFIDIPKKYLDMGYCMDTLIVDHIRDGDDDNFDDNTVWNLQWLTYRENTAKASKCGYREAFALGFRSELDQMILNDYDNDSIYKFCKDVYGYSKEDIKATLQVRRRRLGKTLKEHYERDKNFVNQVDSLILRGMSNAEIREEIFFTESNKSIDRFLQYRRSILNKPAQSSKYLSNNDNERMIILIKEGKSNKEIIDYFKLNNLDKDTLTKINATINSRRCIYKKQMREIK